MTDLPASVTGQTALEVAAATLRQVGAMLRHRFYEAKVVSYKGPSDLVTDVDLEAERRIRQALSAAFPEAAILGEELGATGEGGLRWIIDPIDGTRNFAAGVPHFATSVALARDGEVLLGATYDAMRDELFHGVRGGGAYLNGRPLAVSRRTALAQCLLGFDIGSMDPKALHALRLVEHLWPGMQSVRIMGSATLGLAYAAAGRVDLYFHHTLSPWDVAAGLLLVREAGGQVLDRRTQQPATLDSSGLVASSPALLAEFLRLTRGQGWYTAA
ncbi:MAG: inositol monophosphatase [Chloroflexi bacterium]|nr:inositol monophosphatase [Chloroflexota bacterium]